MAMITFFETQWSREKTMKRAKKNLMIWISVTIAAVVLAVAGLWERKGVEARAGEPLMKVNELSPAQARQLLQEHAQDANFVVLDVRTPGEFAAGHLNKAQNIDVSMPDFSSRLNELDKTKSYLVYCRTGNRSRHALQAMDATGFGRVYHLSNGVRGWQSAGYALEK